MFLASVVQITSALPSSVPQATCPADSVALPWCQVVGDLASPQFVSWSLAMSLVNPLARSALLGSWKYLAEAGPALSVFCPHWSTACTVGNADCTSETGCEPQLLEE